MLFITGFYSLWAMPFFFSFKRRQQEKSLVPAARLMITVHVLTGQTLKHSKTQTQV